MDHVKVAEKILNALGEPVDVDQFRSPYAVLGVLDKDPRERVEVGKDYDPDIQLKLNPAEPETVSGYLETDGFSGSSYSLEDPDYREIKRLTAA